MCSRNDSEPRLTRTGTNISTRSPEERRKQRRRWTRSRRERAGVTGIGITSKTVQKTQIVRRNESLLVDTQTLSPCISLAGPPHLACVASVLLHVVSVMTTRPG